MKKERKAWERWGIRKGLLLLLLAAVMVLAADRLALVSHAQSTGRVTATNANIRKDPDRNSAAVGSAVKGKELTINSQVQGSDGKIWYQVVVNATTTGYIRSDLVEITDGSTPPAAGDTPGGAPAGTVEPVNPVNATVKGGEMVRIRSGASTANEIVTTVSNGLVVTVTGRITDAAGKVWYKVNFNDNGAEKEGFIREDFVTVSGEVTPYVPPAQDDTPVEPDTQEPAVDPTVKKDFETAQVDGEWYLLDYTSNTQHRIQELFDQVNNNAAAYEAEHKRAESGKIIIIILIFLLVAAVSGIAVLVFKIKDMSDDAYFNQVERETLKRRGGIGGKGESRKGEHMSGAGKSPFGKLTGSKRSGDQLEAPKGQRPSGGQSGTPGQRPPGGPGGAPGQRPSGGPGGAPGQRPSGGPGGAPGQRPSGGPGGAPGQRPSGGSGGAPGQRLSGSPSGAPAQRVNGSQPGGQRPAVPGGSQPGQSAAPRKQGQQNWQSKNFIAEEDDEFEFGFLNYDGTEEK